MAKRIAVDIGNSTIACGLFENDRMVSKWYHSIDETEEAALSLSEKQRSENAVTVAISSVVPSARERLLALLQKAGIPSIAISLQSQTSISDTYPTLGHDRLANTMAVYKLYVKGAADAGIVIDFGTATTLTGVSKAGNLLGGMITLGLRETMKAIYSNIDQLPLLDVENVFQRDKINPLATTTEEAILNGTVLGHIAMVEHWIAEGKRKMGGSVVVVATGGLSHFFSDALTGSVNYFDADLTLKGINFIAGEAMDLKDPA
ncbi:MAG: type III pantothenate kinase [Candidatus Melainabacteria bacterium]|nr:type III pantothenate kinase [Candidatus Melainabacteria bacterium]